MACSPARAATHRIALAAAALVACDRAPAAAPAAAPPAAEAPAAAPTLAETPAPGAQEGPLAHALWERARRVGAAMEWSEPAFESELAEGGSRDVQLVLYDARCYRVVSAAGPGVQEVDLLLFDPNGVLQQQDAAEGPAPVLGERHPVCPAEPGVWRLRVQVTRGQGPVAVRALRSTL